MGKSNVSTRASASSSPRGLGTGTTGKTRTAGLKDNETNRPRNTFEIYPKGSNMDALFEIDERLQRDSDFSGTPDYNFNGSSITFKSAEDLEEFEEKVVRIIGSALFNSMVIRKKG